jgi:hypothetical protein
LDWAIKSEVEYYRLKKEKLIFLSIKASAKMYDIKKSYGFNPGKFGLCCPKLKHRAHSLLRLQKVKAF